jgi:hypothetical protein
MTFKSLQNRAFPVLAVALGTLFAGCAGSATAPLPPVQPLDQAERASLDSARTRWSALDLQNYQFETRKGCLCPPEEQQWRHIEVRDGHIVAVIPDGSQATTLQRIAEPGWWTIDELFASIVARADSATETDLRISYDASLGYPTSVREIGATPDNEVSFYVKDVRPL